MSKVKCIIFDLDNTLWNGVVLEGNTVLKPEVLPLLKELDRRGILMSISSKGDRETSMKELSKYGIEQYFIFPMISWQEKWRSIDQISQYTHISIENIAFVDDSIYELQEVHSYLPQITCVTADKLDMILDNQKFCVDIITQETQNRRRYFISEMNYLRDMKLMEQHKFLKSLNMSFCYRKMKGDDLPRVSELANRTKKLNTNHECKSYRTKKKSVVFEYADVYFQHGIVGFANYYYDLRVKSLHY